MNAEQGGGRSSLNGIARERKGVPPSFPDYRQVGKRHKSDPRVQSEPGRHKGERIREGGSTVDMLLEEFPLYSERIRGPMTIAGRA